MTRIPKPTLKIYYLAQRPELATHLATSDYDAENRTICGQKLGPYLSYHERAVLRNGQLRYVGGGPAFHHVDCQRCRKIVGCT